MLDRNPHAWLVIKLRMFIELSGIKVKDHMNMNPMSMKYINKIEEIKIITKKRVVLYDTRGHIARQTHLDVKVDLVAFQEKQL